GQWSRSQAGQLGKSITAAGDGDHETVPPAMFVQCLPQSRDVDMEVSLFDDATGPQPGHQLVLADDLAPGLGQSAQDADRAPVKPHRLTVAAQFGAPKIERETAEADLVFLHRMPAGRSF